MVARVVLATIAMLALAFAAGAWYLYGPVRVPAGYHFPRHSMWGGGPGGLYEGTLAETDGCVHTHDGFSVAWPPGYRLDTDDGQVVVRGGGRTVRMGEQVRMGGGWYEGDPLPDILAGAKDAGCPMPIFLSTGWAD
jgi:hypothetical protein